MSKETASENLYFPMNGEVPSAEVLIIRDVDVVGVGAVRRHQLEELQKTKKFVLQTYEEHIPQSVHSIYQAELLRTLQWLRPVKTEEGQKFDFLKEQESVFSRIFPLTQQRLGLAAKRVRDTYLEEMEWSSWLLQDHWRYFVGFLKQKFPDNKELGELAHWEWVKAWIEIQPFDLGAMEAGLVFVNPSLQIVSLSQANSVLNRDKGVYAFVFSDKSHKVSEKALDLYEAQLIDLLQEDRKFTKEQLIQMALLSEVTPTIAAEEWEKKFSQLVSNDIIKR
ncbi:hypothetical protein [Bdellovibrio bacteriovorus]|uniref:hypothetical protein n=1 Tax=Bdellovibrio bacteriovorus TaxID=959 RepID=UPI000A66CAC5|nr:hypothetical protein [Bdellovibrio bacteriovorus]